MHNVAMIKNPCLHFSNESYGTYAWVFSFIMTTYNFKYKKVINEIKYVNQTLLQMLGCSQRYFFLIFVHYVGAPRKTPAVDSKVVIHGIISICISYII